jgi:hypothetical protein
MKNATCAVCGVTLATEAAAPWIPYLCEEASCRSVQEDVEIASWRWHKRHEIRQNIRAAARGQVRVDALREQGAGSYWTT